MICDNLRFRFASKGRTPTANDNKLTPSVNGDISDREAVLSNAEVKSKCHATAERMNARVWRGRNAILITSRYLVGNCAGGTAAKPDGIGVGSPGEVCDSRQEPKCRSQSAGSLKEDDRDVVTVAEYEQDGERKCCSRAVFSFSSVSVLVSRECGTRNTDRKHEYGMPCGVVASRSNSAVVLKMV